MPISQKLRLLKNVPTELIPLGVVLAYLLPSLAQSHIILSRHALASKRRQIET